VPPEIDFGDWTAIAPLFDQLEARAAACSTVEAFELWLLDWGELSAALDEESSRRYIAMTCHTDDAVAKHAYLRFVEEIEPKLKPRQFNLSRLYLAHPQRRQLPSDRYRVLDRDTEVHVELYRDANVPLQTEETKLEQQYQEITGALTVTFQGEERTLPQMARLLELPDRAVRQEAWELTARRRLQEAPRLEEIFNQ
jgi:oligoendopeptidase F